MFAISFDASSSTFRPSYLHSPPASPPISFPPPPKSQSPTSPLSSLSLFPSSIVSSSNLFGSNRSWPTSNTPIDNDNGTRGGKSSTFAAPLYKKERPSKAVTFAMDTSIQPFNTGGIRSPGAPPAGFGTTADGIATAPATTGLGDFPSISLDTEMMDDDEIMAMQPDEPINGFAQQEPVATTTTTAPAPAVRSGSPLLGQPENVVNHKIHLRGLDNMSSTDVKDFVGSHFPDAQVEKLEWIDDTSLNLVYKDDATAAAALVALSSEASFGLAPWDLREAKRSDKYPLAKLDIRLAVVTDRKEKGARERSRYYLFHPEEDRVEQHDKIRREREQERRERRREQGDYRQRDYDDRYRRDSRERDDDRRRSRSRYDGEDDRRRERETFELFPNGGTSDRRGERRRSRSRSPVELFPGQEKNAAVELFPGETKNASVELFPEEAATVELFPEQPSRNARGRDRGDVVRDDAPKTLFSIDDPVEAPKKGASPQRQRIERERPRDGGKLELFPEPTGRGSLADRIDKPRGHGNRSEDTEMGGSNSGLSIRGTAGGGISFRGAASGIKSNAGIELLPDKAANSLFNRVSDAPAGGRRGARRQKAEDLFG